MKRLFLKAAIDGLVRSLLLFVSGIFFVSAYAKELSARQYLLVVLLCSVLSAAVFVALLRNMVDSKTILCFSVTSFCCFVLCVVIILGIQLIFKINWVPLRETNTADGFLLLIATGCFVVASVALRILAIVLRIIKKNTRTDLEMQKAEDRSEF